MYWGGWNVEAKPASGPVQDPKTRVRAEVGKSGDQNKDKTETVHGAESHLRSVESGFGTVNKSFGFGLN